MKQQTSPVDTGVPPAFLNRFGNSVTGVLPGFDRLQPRGTLRHLFQPTVMEACLNACRVLIKNFGTFAQGPTERVKHSVNGNSVEMHDKEGGVLRIETTINKTGEKPLRLHASVLTMRS